LHFPVNLTASLIVGQGCGNIRMMNPVFCCLITVKKESAMITDIPVGTTEGMSTTRQDYSQSASSSSLREELSDLKSDLDALMSHASTLTDKELQEARDRIMGRFSSMRFAARGMAAQASKQLNDGMDVTVDYVRERPLQSVAIAAGAGLLLGALMRRS